MDKLTALELSQRILKNPAFEDKYNRRYQKGDIIEVREDGAPVTDNEKEKFLLVHLNGVAKADALFLMDRLNDKTNPEKIVRRRKYKINFTMLPQNIQDEILQGKEITVNNTVFNAARITKSG